MDGHIEATHAVDKPEDRIPEFRKSAVYLASAKQASSFP